MPEEEKKVSVSFVRRYRLAEHTCPVCGTVFHAPRLRVYCSSGCKQKAAWERLGNEFNERRKAKQNETEAREVKGDDNEKAQ